MISISLNEVEDIIGKNVNINQICRTAYINWILDDIAFEFANRPDFNELITNLIKEEICGEYTCSIHHGFVLMFHFETEEDYIFWLLQNG